MEGSFACPECGNSLELKGLTPGREVRCGWCRTWVEVPFLPRVGPKRRGLPARRRTRRWAAWAWGGLGLTALLVLATGTSRMLQVQSRQVHERALDRLSASARDDERAGRYGPALAAIEAALVEAARIAPWDDARLDELRAWRDRVARREVEGRLAEVAGLAPEPAVGACLTLLARVRDNPGLGSFEGTVGEQLDRARERWVEADLKAARQALDAGHGSQVLDHCERLVATARTLTSEVRPRARAEADALVARVIASRGVVLGAVQGQFLIGSGPSYSAALEPMFLDTLRHRGYLPRPASSFWMTLWDRLAPFHLSVNVAEGLPDQYLQSENRISAIEVRLVLTRKGQPQSLWEGIANAQTRTPIPRLPAYQASRLAVSAHRNPAIEQLLYEDARALLLERIGLSLRSLPEVRSPLAPSPERANALEPSRS